MTDRSLRTLSRDQSPEGQARLLRARCRAGERVPLTKAEVEGVKACLELTSTGWRACDSAACSGHAPDPSKTYTQPPAVPLADLLRLRAYAGGETARAVFGPGVQEWLPFPRGASMAFAPTFALIDRWDLDQWARGVLDCVPEDAHLVGERPCEECERGMVLRCRTHEDLFAGCSGLVCPLEAVDCENCEGTGRVSWTVSLRHHLAVTVGVAVGRACLPTWEASSQAYGLSTANPGMGVERRPRRALDAAALWLRCPCEEHRQACMEHLAYMPGLAADSVRWWTYVVLLAGGASEEPAGYMLGSQLQGAARLLGPDEVRRVASEAVLGWAGGEAAGVATTP